MAACPVEPVNFFILLLEFDTFFYAQCTVVQLVVC